MRCWLCKVPITETNSSGKMRGGLKNECIACHSVYNLFYKLIKLDKALLEKRLDELINVIESYKLVLSYPDLSVKELSKKFLEVE